MKRKEKATCNSCGYSGKMETTLSATSWGRCPKCGTTDLTVEVWCSCGAKMTNDGYMGLPICRQCTPANLEGGK